MGSRVDGCAAEALPGYVRLALRVEGDAARARAASRRFAALCSEEGILRGMIVADSHDAPPDDALEAAAQGMRPGFKLACVARGPQREQVSRSLARMARRRRATARMFPAEHLAAAWLMS